ncbi:glycoside hydrolase family 97 protein [Sphingobacterium sp.]|uniref:glycoside hydrolase family 97 protein n=1 Tax=Sphingobacterium sp. TaxID=341027 RepID=UPI0031CFCE94
MRNTIFALLLLVLFQLGFAQESQWKLTSPDGKITVNLNVDSKGLENYGKLLYTVYLDGKLVLEPAPLGIDREDQQFDSDLAFVSSTEPRLIDEHYRLKSGKQLLCRNHANERVVSFQNTRGKEIQLIWRAYDDGIAFRYRFAEKDTKSYKIIREHTGFRLPTNGRAWIHPYDWNSRQKPSYEQYCQNNIAIGTDSPNPKGWAYPMLVKSEAAWIMITEAVLDGTYCATHLRSTNDGLYTVNFAEKEEVALADSLEPTSGMPWQSPWRVIVLGDSLSDIVETNIVQHLNPPSVITNDSWIQPGRSSWSWWSNGGSPKNFSVQKQYVDFSAEMGWEYILIDAGWPVMSGGSMEDVVRYAQSKGVGVWLWYHSGSGQRMDSISNRNLMSDQHARRAELARLQKLGVKGIKVDFFDSDKQGIVRRYQEILADAAKYEIMVNFHGATLPRGLERTYPNLMTTEAIKGAEGFGRQENCDRAPVHNATIPFTRNVVGSMDYTPVTFSNKVRQGVEAFNRTSFAHQLALAVVFESGVQCFADKIESYRELPEAPRNFLKHVPTAWDETKLLDGFPGDFVIIARRKGDTWYVGGINGKDEKRSLTFSLPFIPNSKPIKMITDGGDRSSFAVGELESSGKIQVNMLPYGGFTGTIKL